MLSVIKTATGYQLATENDDARHRETRWDWKEFTQAENVANSLTTTSGKLYIAVDRGECVAPRYDVIEAPALGDAVSYTFNGDTTPCGFISKISKSLRRIETTEGRVFYRQGTTGTWKNGRTWSMVNGHHTERNPHF